MEQLYFTACKSGSVNGRAKIMIMIYAVRQRAFTMVEVMIAVGILVALSALLIGNVQEWRLRTSAADMAVKLVELDAGFTLYMRENGGGWPVADQSILGLGTDSDVHVIAQGGSPLFPGFRYVHEDVSFVNIPDVMEVNYRNEEVAYTDNSISSAGSSCQFVGGDVPGVTIRVHPESMPTSDPRWARYVNYIEVAIDGDKATRDECGRVYMIGGSNSLYYRVADDSYEY